MFLSLLSFVSYNALLLPKNNFEKNHPFKEDAVKVSLHEKQDSSTFQNDGLNYGDEIIPEGESSKEEPEHEEDFIGSFLAHRHEEIEEEKLPSKIVVEREKGLTAPLPKQKPLVNKAFSEQKGKEPKREELKSDATDMEKTIKRVQEALRAFGEYDLVVSGKYDKATVDAIKNFQKIFSLPVSGYVDKQLLEKLKELSLYPE